MLGFKINQKALGKKVGPTAIMLHQELLERKGAAGLAVVLAHHCESWQGSACSRDECVTPLWVLLVELISLSQRSLTKSQ